jgi:hypothetical protein
MHERTRTFDVQSPEVFPRSTPNQRSDDSPRRRETDGRGSNGDETACYCLLSVPHGLSPYL